MLRRGIAIITRVTPDKTANVVHFSTLMRGRGDVDAYIVVVTLEVDYASTSQRKSIKNLKRKTITTVNDNVIAPTPLGDERQRGQSQAAFKTPARKITTQVGTRHGFKESD